MTHIEQLDEDTVAFFLRGRRGKVQEFNMINLLIGRPIELHRRRLPHTIAFVMRCVALHHHISGFFYSRRCFILDLEKPASLVMHRQA